MAGKHNGVGAKLRKKVNDSYPDSPFAHFYSIIHQQNLCSKVLKLDHVTKLVSKKVNYIRGQALNHRQFRQMLQDMENEFTGVPFYNPASKVVQIRAALVPVPSPDKWGGLRQEGHPA